MKPQAGIRILPSTENVLELLSQELSQFSAEALKDVLIILPTQRLGQYLLALLGVHNRTFLAPSLLTLENFIQQQAPSQLDASTILSPSAEELLLASLIKQSAFKHLQKGHEHEIREFFSQIHQAEMGANTFEKLKTLILRDIYRDPAHIGSLIERVEELRLLFDQYENLLKSKNALSSEQFAIACVHAIMETWSSSQTLPWRWVYLGCFTTSKAYCRPMLRLFSKKENVSLLFTEPPKLLGQHSPLRELLEAILEKPVRSAHDDLPLLSERTLVLAAPSVLSETQAALATIRDAIAQGCPESRIGLLVSDEKSYGKILATLLEKEKFKSNLAIAQPFAETAIGSWLVSVLNYLLTLRTKATSPETKKEETRLLRECLAHPLTWRSLAPQSDFETFLATQYDLTDPETASEANLNLLTLLANKVAPCANLMRKRKPEFLTQWQNALMELIGNFAFLNPEPGDLNSFETPKEKWDFKRADLEAFKQFCDFFEQWALVWDKKISGSECLFALLDKIQSLETRSVGFPLEGVQILDIIEARYVPFEFVVVLGCTEGRFPRSLPNDRLVGDLLKVKLGMPGWQYIEALEDTTFHLLCGQARYFTFLYSVSPDYGSLCRSRFIERILAQDKAQWSECSAPGLSDAQATLSPTRFPDLRGDYSHERLPLFEEVSAHSLGQLFRCPYQFLMSKLGVKEQREESPSLWEGRWLHEILEAFYTGQLRDLPILEPMPAKLVLSESEIVPFAIARLNTLTAHALPENVLGSPFHMHVLHFAWPRFAQYWAKFFEHESGHSYVFATQDSLKEFALSGKGLILDRKTDTYASLLGTLDSLDILSPASVLIDYKRKNVDAMSDVVQGLSPQLPLYALAMAQNRFQDDKNFLESCLVGNWSIIEGRWQARGVGESARPWALAKKLATAQTPPLTPLVQRLQTLWQDNTQSLLHAKEPFAPIPSEACDYCAFTGICRKEDPVYTATHVEEPL